jgi:hypothetical protein
MARTSWYVLAKKPAQLEHDRFMLLTMSKPQLRNTAVCVCLHLHHNYLLPVLVYVRAPSVYDVFGRETRFFLKMLPSVMRNRFDLKKIKTYARPSSCVECTSDVLL